VSKAPSLDNIEIVLSHTSEPENIGATARAMKTMGLTNLTLINPLNPHGSRAKALAHGATDVLENARIVETLPDAIGHMIVLGGTTARPRELRKGALITPAEMATKLVTHSCDGPVGLMFGTERSGMDNDEIYACRYVSMIDTSDAHSSLNLAQAVMLFSWEIRKAFIEITQGKRKPNFPPEMRVSHPHRKTRLPTAEELDSMYSHMGTAMTAVGYSEDEKQKFLTYISHIHMRAGIVNWEIQVYHLLAKKILEATGTKAYRKQKR
jgi:tRNA (cytidine32/uridine32-2'-O)-methyltransferase